MKKNISNFKKNYFGKLMQNSLLLVFEITVRVAYSACGHTDSALLAYGSSHLSSLFHVSIFIYVFIFIFQLIANRISINEIT